MDAHEITYEELFADDEPACPGLPKSFAQLLADGFPCQGGISALVAIEQLPDPAPQFAAVQRGVRKLLEEQRAALKRSTQR